MREAVRQRVRTRAGFRCEYCGLREEDLPWITFHVEHIIAKKHGGGDDDSNLALACDQCNLHKGPNLAGIDPVTREVTNLFHPRFDTWNDHFAFHDGMMLGTTPKGRATVEVCDMNSPQRLELRSWLAEFGSD